MNRCFYTLVYYLLLPFIFLRLLWRARKAPDYAKRWPERLGFFRHRLKLAGFGCIRSLWGKPLPLRH